MRLIGRKVRAARAAENKANPTRSLLRRDKKLRRWYPGRHEKLYNSPKWKELRLHILGNRPVCQACGKRPAEEVDHEVRHKGNPKLFWDPGNLVALCPRCHRYKTRFERRPSVEFHDPSRPKPRLVIGNDKRAASC